MKGGAYNEAGFFDVASEFSVLGKEAVAYVGQKYSLFFSQLAKRTRVNHLNAMLFGNLDDLVASQVSTHWGVLASLADDVGFISL